MINLKTIGNELLKHSPFTALATIIAIIIAILIYYFFQFNLPTSLFHYFHFLHLIISALVTAALFYKYKKNFFQALLIGFLGAILIGSLSDIILPYLGASFLGLEIHFHLPLIEKPLLTIFFALVGSLIGILTIKTNYPHLIHVFLSVFASLFYFLTYSDSFTLLYFSLTFFIVFIAVIIPCCLSDIIFPLLFIPKKIRRKINSFNNCICSNK